MYPHVTQFQTIVRRAREQVELRAAVRAGRMRRAAALVRCRSTRPAPRTTPSASPGR